MTVITGRFEQAPAVRCISRERSADITGQVFGRLTALDRAGHSRGKRLLWLCRCECGKPVTTDVSALRSGRTKSCGCLKADITRARMTTHGLRGHKEYRRWNLMVFRCHGQKTNRWYYQRGIKVCDRWRFGEGGKTGFECFIADMGVPPFEGATLDRIDNDGNYEPGNVRWATALQQNHNKRPSTQTYPKGVAHHLSKLSRAEVRRIRRLSAGGLGQNAIARKLGIGRTIVQRVVKGVSYVGV